MCAKFLYLILAAFFVFVVGTIAAFVYLEWWQALLVSLAIFVTLIYAAKVYVRRQFRGLRRVAEGLFTQKSSALKGATVEVHSVRPAAMPDTVKHGLTATIDPDDPVDEDDDRESDDVPDYANYQWAEVEMTVFPPADVARAFTHWDLDGLRLVPIDAPKLGFSADEEVDRPEYELWDVRLVDGGVASEPDEDKLDGPRRLRFTVGVPRGTRLLKVQYFFEQFGRIELPALLGLPPGGPR
jgi:hypothetical protein